MTRSVNRPLDAPPPKASLSSPFSSLHITVTVGPRQGALPTPFCAQAQPHPWEGILFHPVLHTAWGSSYSGGRALPPRQRAGLLVGGGLALLGGGVEWVGVAVPCLLDYLAVPSFRGPDPGALGAEPGLELLLLSQLRTEPGTHIPCLTGTTFVYKLFGRINNYLDVDNSLNLK